MKKTQSTLLHNSHTNHTNTASNRSSTTTGTERIEQLSLLQQLQQKHIPISQLLGQNSNNVGNSQEWGGMQMQMAQLGFRVEKLEQEAILAQERVNSLTRICQLQQQFQENWEEETQQMKKFFDGQGKNLSLIEELEQKNMPTIENLQEQINKLGEEVALDINDLEKKLQLIQSQVSLKSALPSTPHSHFMNTQTTHQDQFTAQFQTQIQAQIQALTDERNKNVEEVKLVQVRQQKLGNQLSSVKYTTEKLRERVRNLEKVVVTQHEQDQSQVSKKRSRSRSKSQTNFKKAALKEQVAVLIDGLGALQSQVSTLLQLQPNHSNHRLRQECVSFAEEVETAPTIQHENQPNQYPSLLNIQTIDSNQQQQQSEFKRLRKSPHNTSSSKKLNRQKHAFDAFVQRSNQAAKENEGPPVTLKRQHGGLDVRTVAKEIEIEQQKILQSLSNHLRSSSSLDARGNTRSQLIQQVAQNQRTIDTCAKSVTPQHKKDFVLGGRVGGNSLSRSNTMNALKKGGGNSKTIQSVSRKMMRII
ncbi:hypothetical protein FGO68_gene3813 [Halteria grandinella]|uniref:Uncharacterized protein n=1 Tax=Halteria grandinella TaxID=5974 RepID=A0A8J8NRI3_HALGN|nr:hypothetical protein FGO68_gene3813 [Halteria grandinella]